jgi:MoaA/NifB/PqqE/SkfB family radical SAM enzyme
MMELFQPTAQLKISLTSNCNNDCAICLNKTTRARGGSKTGLAVEKILELIDEAAAMGMVGTYWTGGEPLTEYKNLTKLIKYSTNKGLLSTIVTNGGLIGAFGNYKKLNQELLKEAGLYNLRTGEIVRSLKEAGLARVYFSIDNSHTTLESADSNVLNSVPAEVAAIAIKAFLKEGFGKIHKLDAIGYQLRVTATSSGLWDIPTDMILQEVMDKVGVKLEKEISSRDKVYGNEKGQIYLKRLGISNTGDAETLNDDILENRTGKNLFSIRCPHFTSKKQAYDNGKYHRDLYIDYNGIVYTCGNHAYPVGNIFKESLSAIIKGINSPNLEGEFGRNRAVFHSLLRLSQNEKIGNNAIGEALRLINSENPKLIQKLKTQCGSCNCLGTRKELQEAFLKACEWQPYNL